LILIEQKTTVRSGIFLIAVAGVILCADLTGSSGNSNL